MNLFAIVKSQIAILDVVSQYATLRKAGAYYKGACPFHAEKTASFTISPHKEIFYCFGCHVGGDVITFIAKAERCSPMEALHFLAERYQLALPEQQLVSAQDRTKSHEEKTRYHALHQLLAEWLHDNLMKSPAVFNYLKQRGINRETIVRYQIGYFPKETIALDRLITHVRQYHFLLEDLLNFGIVMEGKTNVYSPFEQRIVFPIKDHLGRTCGFGARTFVKDDERPKYYNSRENSQFTKGTLLFGLDLAKSAMQMKESAFIVEGYMDCIAMAQHGFHATVATLGTACTIEQLRLLARYVRTLYVMYDGDRAGQQAMVRLAQLCWQVTMELKIVALPAGYDPASLLQQAQSITPYIEQAKDIFEYCIAHYAQDFFQKNLHEKVALIRNTIQIVHAIGDPLKREIVLQQAAKAFAVPLEAVRAELGRTVTTPAQPQEPSEEQKVGKSGENSLEKLPMLEKKIFSVIINNMQSLSPEDDAYVAAYFSEPLCGLYKKLRVAAHTQQGFIDFFETLDRQEKNIVSQLVVEYQQEGAEHMQHLLGQLRKKHWKAVVADTKLQLAQAMQEKNTQRIEQILLHFQELRRKLLRKELL